MTTVVLVDLAAPYLGGAETWRRLVAELDDVRCVVLDPLDDAAAPDVAGAVRARIAREIVDGASAIVAHAASVRLAIEAAHATASDVPILLLNPVLFARRTRLGTVLGASFELPFASALARGALAAYARRETRRLRHDRRYLERRLRLYAGRGTLDAALLDEAAARVRDARASALDSTTALVTELIRPVEPAAMRATQRRRRALVAGLFFTRLAARSMPVINVPAGDGAPMIANAQFVAATLRQMLAAYGPYAPSAPAGD